ncbi:hypothetical protein IW262DRAFT_1300598 [Armillaria fumosa]|nr:hypothetical protein IW262DRAFT_1300598 [Armillaria fumosa]
MVIYISPFNTSTFLDLEAGVSCKDEVDSLYEDNNEDFITEEDSSDGMTDSTAFDRATALTVAEESQAWMSFLERARSHANGLKSSLETDCGWEESVVLHIGWCMQPELGIKTAFISSLVGETGDIGIPEPKLFDLAAIEQARHYVVKEGQSSYCFQGSKYDHDLLAHQIYFSQLEIANEITKKLANLFAQLGHPLVRRSIGILPRVSEWCFQVSKVITDISRHISGTILSVGKHGLEVKFADGLFPKEFEIGTYVEITGEEHATRWSGWVHGIDDGLLHLISCSGPENERIEICGVHSNSVSAIALPHITSIHWDSNSQCLDPISIVPWKGVMVQVIMCGHSWHGKTGYVVDVNIMRDLHKKKEILQFLFHYLNIVDEESWLPLNEAHPIVKDTDFFRNLIPVTNVLGERGRRLPPPEPAA